MGSVFAYCLQKLCTLQKNSDLEAKKLIRSPISGRNGAKQFQNYPGQTVPWNFDRDQTAREPHKKFPDPNKQFSKPVKQFRNPDNQFWNPEKQFRIPGSQFRIHTTQFWKTEKQFRNPENPDKQLQNPDKPVPESRRTGPD